jgi:hypothetical protein
MRGILTAMNEDYPGDADGDALRRVAALGADMSRAMEIEFFVAVRDHEAGEAVARLAALAGYRPELVHDEEDDAWDCYCRKTMLPTHEGITAAQRELDELSRPLGGYSDGWGTAGDPIDV